jgi:hypothetical protein
VHHLEEAAHDATRVHGGLVNTVASAILRVIVGALIVLVMIFTLYRRKAKTSAEASTDSP